jgi:hypothetical protein
MLADSQSNKRLGMAILTGGATALGCGIAYAIFVAATGWQGAIATIGIAFVIARVVRKASGGLGGIRFQVLAVALTYLSATMGYIPEMWRELKEAAAEQDKQEAAKTPSAPTDTAAEPASDGAKSKGSLGGVLIAVASLIGIMLAAPLLNATEAPLGLLIVGIGLYEAWKLSRGPPVHLEGPFPVGVAGAAPAAGPPAT